MCVWEEINLYVSFDVRGHSEKFWRLVNDFVWLIFAFKVPTKLLSHNQIIPRAWSSWSMHGTTTASGPQQATPKVRGASRLPSSCVRQGRHLGSHLWLRRIRECASGDRPRWNGKYVGCVLQRCGCQAGSGSFDGKGPRVIMTPECRSGIALKRDFRLIEYYRCRIYRFRIYPDSLA